MNAPRDTLELQSKVPAAMEAPRTVSVSLIGLTVEERQQLHDVFSEIPSGRLLYTLVPLTLRPDILIVNADLTAALAMWVRYRAHIRQLSAVPPSIVVSRWRTFDTAHYQLRAPIGGDEALATLNRVAVEKLGLDEALLVSPALSAPLQQGAVRFRGSDVPDTPDSLAATMMPTRKLSEAPPESLSAISMPPQRRAGPDRLSITTTRDGFGPAPDTPAATVRALVVDDSLPVRIQMRQALQSLSWHIDFAESGEQALEMISRDRYDIVFLDVVLPGIDGYETCRQAKLAHARDTPIVMLTSASSPADRVKGKLAGCNTYLIKPVTPPVLRQLIEQYVGIQ
ncbi:MAG: response regulator [Chromatiales bacterium]